MAQKTTKAKRPAPKKWTAREDKMLISQVRAFPHNLSRCFLLVAEDTGRSKHAVQSHWYNVVSKRPEALCFFTASSQHVSKNRKNGMGVSVSKNIWQRFLRILRSI